MDIVSLSYTMITGFQINVYFLIHKGGTVMPAVYTDSLEFSDSCLHKRIYHESKMNKKNRTIGSLRPENAINKLNLACYA